jgi:hypothetical protein
MPVQLYSYKEVSKHNHRNDLWMIIDGKVYDITKFQDEVNKNYSGHFFRLIKQVSTREAKRF